jgi:hypothetical protein
MARMKQHKRAYEVQYFFWGRGRGRADAKGFNNDLKEAYANACRHLGRSTLYWKAVIIDREQGTIIAIIKRYMGSISIEEK